MSRLAVVFQFWEAMSPASSLLALRESSSINRGASPPTGSLSSYCDQLPTVKSQTQAPRNTGVSSPKTDGMCVKNWKREPITPLSAQFTALHQDEGLGSGTTWSSLNGVSTLVQKMETTSGQVLSRARAFLVRRPLDPAQQFQEGSG